MNKLDYSGYFSYRDGFQIVLVSNFDLGDFYELAENLTGFADFAKSKQDVRVITGNPALLSTNFNCKTLLYLGFEL